MAKLTDIPVVTSLDDADLIYAVDVSDTTDDPAGSSKAITKANLIGGGGGGNSTPTVQSVKFNGADGTVAWNSESGWSSVREGVGTYLITFPTAATSLDEQALVGNTNLDASSAPCVVYFYDITSTTARAAVRRTDTDAALDYDFSVVRTLGTSAAGGGGSLPAGTVVKEEIARITDPVGGEFDFTVPAGYDSLILEGQLRSTSALAVDAVYVYLNGDTTDSNYTSQYVTGDNGSGQFAEVAGPTVAIAPDSSSPANAYGDVRVTIGAPDSPKLKNMTGVFTSKVQADRVYSGVIGATSSVSAAITAIAVRTDNDPTDTLTGTLILYGERTL